MGPPLNSLGRAQIRLHGGAYGLAELHGVWRVGMDADRVGADRNVLAADALYLAFLDRADRLVCGFLRVLGIVFAGNDESAVIAVVEIDIELGDHLVSA